MKDATFTKFSMRSPFLLLTTLRQIRRTLRANMISSWQEDKRVITHLLIRILGNISSFLKWRTNSMHWSACHLCSYQRQRNCLLPNRQIHGGRSLREYRV